MYDARVVRPLALLALAPSLAAGCFHDSLPPLTGTAASGPIDATSTTTSTSTTSTSSTSSPTSTGPALDLPPDATSGTTGDCPFGQDAVFYPDKDGDGWGSDSPIPSPCVQPPGAVPMSGDCDDAAPEINPGATELCNAIDDDCDRLLDEHSPKNESCDGCALGSHKGAAYWACADAQNYADARLRCQTRGPTVRLAVADDAQEHEFLRDLALASFPAPPNVIHYYLGLTRRMDLWDDCADHPETDAWLTPAGEPAAFLAWMPGEPNNSGCTLECTSQDIADPWCKRENCVEMVSPVTGNYNDNACGVVQAGYLCEGTS